MRWSSPREWLARTAVFGAVPVSGRCWWSCHPTSILCAPGVFYAQEYFAKMGVTLRLAPTAGGMQAELLEGARLLWLETPSNPGMEICDIAALSEAAHRAGALVAVDNTTPTPLGQLPLSLGADFSVASDTKAMTGHSDLLLGHVAMRDLELRAKIDQWRIPNRRSTGAVGSLACPSVHWYASASAGTIMRKRRPLCRISGHKGGRNHCPVSGSGDPSRSRNCKKTDALLRPRS